jgi:hypothetical protein
MTVLGFVPERRVWRATGEVSPSSWTRLPSAGSLACWHTDNLTTGLVDLVGGITLSAGVHVTPESFPEFGPAGGLHFNGGIHADLQTADSLLRITGDMSIELIARMHESTGASVGTAAYLVSWMNSGNTLADNVLYRLAVTSIASQPFGPRGLVWNSESGAGVLATATFNNGPPVVNATPFYLAATRISDVIRVYVNGRLMGTSGTLTTPAGGTSGSARFCIGGDLDNGNTNPHMCLFSARIHNSGLSQATIQATYTATLGQVYPISF